MHSVQWLATVSDKIFSASCVQVVSWHLQNLEVCLDFAILNLASCFFIAVVQKINQRDKKYFLSNELTSL